MAYTQTTRLGIKKAVPGSAQVFETSVWNDNYDLIDGEFVSVDGRLDTVEAGLDAINVGQDARLTDLEAADVLLDGRLDTLEGQTLNTRLTAAEGEIVTLDSRLDTFDGYNLNTRLTTAEGDITTIESEQTVQNNRLAVLEIATGNPPIDFTVDGGTP